MKEVSSKCIPYSIYLATRPSTAPTEIGHAFAKTTIFLFLHWMSWNVLTVLKQALDCTFFSKCKNAKKILQFFFILFPKNFLGLNSPKLLQIMYSRYQLPRHFIGHPSQFYPYGTRFLWVIHVPEFYTVILYSTLYFFVFFYKVNVGVQIRPKMYTGCKKTEHTYTHIYIYIFIYLYIYIYIYIIGFFMCPLNIYFSLCNAVQNFEVVYGRKNHT